MKINEKLKLIRETEKYTQKNFAECVLCITEQGYQKLEYGDNQPTYKVLQGLCKKFPKYTLWLMTDINDVEAIANQSIKGK